MTKVKAEDAFDGHYWLEGGHYRGEWEVVRLTQTEGGPVVYIIGHSGGVRVALGTMLYGPIPEPTP